MANVHADKARVLLQHAESQRSKLIEDILAGSVSERDLAFRQDDIRTKVAVAQVHATLATAHENEIFEAPAPEQTEAPKDPNEPGQGEQDPTVLFFNSLDDTLAFLRSIRPVADILRGPRPVKDTPQA